MTLTVALFGCGGMGRRHIVGFRKLKEIGRDDIALVAVCDIDRANAELARDRAVELLGEEPQIFASFADLRRALPDLDAIIVTTPPHLHAAIGVEALEAGVHVLVEKPIALTVRQSLQLIEAAERTGQKLAVAENYRRDPINRLAKAVIESGVLGRVFLAVQSTSGAGERVNITPWRHQRQSGGIVVDMGIHYTDLLEFYLGPIERVMGMSDQIDSQRVDAEGVWHPVDAEDLSVGVARFASGAIANWMMNRAGRGETHFTRMLYGTKGSLAIPRDRSGLPLGLMVRRDGKDETIPVSEHLALVPDFRLDATTAALFGGDRLASYTMEFNDIDANLLAIELADFADAIIEDRAPEVTGVEGLRALAVVYGFLESERSGGTVFIDRFMQGEESSYFKEIEATPVSG
jgi:predicted dehydrogenase